MADQLDAPVQQEDEVSASCQTRILAKNLRWLHFRSRIGGFRTPPAGRKEGELIPSLEHGGMIVNRTSVDVQELAVLALDRSGRIDDDHRRSAFANAGSGASSTVRSSSLWASACWIRVQRRAWSPNSR